MLLRILFSYIIGYVKISVEGYFIERFINICKNEKVAIWNLKRDKNIRLELKVGIRDFKKVCKIAKKTKCKIKILNKKFLGVFGKRFGFCVMPKFELRYCFIKL